VGKAWPRGCKTPRAWFGLIDDAHDFTGDNDYPTLEDLNNYIISNRGEIVFEIKDDIIRIHKN
jgi:hypothetical protein